MLDYKMYSYYFTVFDSESCRETIDIIEEMNELQAKTWPDTNLRRKNND
ncbi:MAG: hypothetical protein ACXAEU_24410 [Candidatus Hodarchaeales archaeon]